MPNAVSAIQATGLGSTSMTIVGVIALLAVFALGLGLVFRSQVLKANAGSEKMQEIAGAVEEGAKAYLNRQFRTLALFVLLVCALLFLLPGDAGIRTGRSIAFIIGAVFSAVIGSVGMRLAVKANVRVAAAAGEENGYAKGAKVAFRTGGTVGLFTVGLGLLGATGTVLIFREQAPGVLEGFGFGAALLAMFMRVGGGIFTKAADVGADLVGKVEQGIPEDDPRNPATIADNVGDNVGDCAGMAADLFESYAVTLVASLILGKAAFGEQGLVFPLLITSIGVLTAAIGVYLTKMRPGENGLTAINRGFYISAVIGAVLSVIAAYVYLPNSFDKFNFAAVGATSPYFAGEVMFIKGDPRLLTSVAVIIGIVLAGFILWLTGYFTGTDKPPTMKVARTSRTGAATVVLSGIGLGLESAVYTAVAIGGAVFLLFTLAGGLLNLSLFFLAVAGCGLLTTVGVIVAMDTFGPVSDNAQGIAEMSGECSEEAAEILTGLDAVGNTTKAITKGIAIATAVLAAAALFGSYTDALNTSVAEVGREALASASIITQSALLDFTVFNPANIFGLILGAATVFLFSGLATDAVTRAAGSIVFEVRRQFRENPGIMTYDTKPNYAACVDICTKDSLRELITPGLLAAMAPIAVGFGLGPGPLAAFLAGSIICGVLMAVFLSNAGGAWDNAKKIVEDGAYGGKGSDAHAATVIGDTVGDPFKDTAGPAINPLIKVMNLVALLIVPAVVTLSVGENQKPGVRVLIAFLALVVILGAVLASKLRRSSMDEDFDDDDFGFDEEEIEGGGDPTVAIVSVEDDPATTTVGATAGSPLVNLPLGKSDKDAPAAAFVGSSAGSAAALPGGSGTTVPIKGSDDVTDVYAPISDAAPEASADSEADTDESAAADEVAAAEAAADKAAAEKAAADKAAAEKAAADKAAAEKAAADKAAAEKAAADKAAAEKAAADKAAAEKAAADKAAADKAAAEKAAADKAAADKAAADKAAADKAAADKAAADKAAADKAAADKAAADKAAADKAAADKAAADKAAAEKVAADKAAADKAAADKAAAEKAAADKAAAEKVAADKAAADKAAADKAAAEKAAKATVASAPAGDAPFGPDSAAADDNGDGPEGFTIKGNTDSMKYHAPDSPWYKRTWAEVWFKTEAAAEAAGFVNAGGPRGFKHEAGPYANSALPAADGSGPSDHPIKGNEDSKKFHGPDSPWYARTKAEVWFKTEADARAAGFKKPGE